MTLTRGVLLYAESRSILMSIGGMPCSIWSHDIMHLISLNIYEVPMKYLSLICCNGCGMAHTKLSEVATSGVISEHCFEFIFFSGFTPRLLITDKAKSEVKGRMEELIKDLNVVINHTNYETLKLQQDEDTRKLVSIAEENTKQEQTEGGRPQEFEDQLLN